MDQSKMKQFGITDNDSNKNTFFKKSIKNESSMFIKKSIDQLNPKQRPELVAAAKLNTDRYNIEDRFSKKVARQPSTALVYSEKEST